MDFGCGSYVSVEALVTKSPSKCDQQHRTFPRPFSPLAASDDEFPIKLFLIC